MKRNVNGSEDARITARGRQIGGSLFSTGHTDCFFTCGMSIYLLLPPSATSFVFFCCRRATGPSMILFHFAIIAQRAAIMRPIHLEINSELNGYGTS